MPLHTNAEINRPDVTNTTDEPAVIDVTGSVEWCLWNAVDDSSNFQRNLSTGEVEIERETDATPLYHKTEFKERRNHYAFFAVNSPVVGFDTSRDEFLGQFNGWDTPQVIAEGKAHDSVAHGWLPIAANRVRLELQPDETASLVFMLGYIEVAKDQKWEDPNDPAKVGIIDIASTQMEDGSAWHQYQPLTKKGNADIGGGFNDDPLWLVAGVYAYLAETGDVSILTEPVPFNNVEGSEQPLLEHLRRSVNFTITHKVPMAFRSSAAPTGMIV